MRKKTAYAEEAVPMQVFIAEDLKRKFKIRVAEQGKTMGGTISELVARYLKESK